MKEKIFDQKIEEAANRFEDWIEASADTFERELTRTWNEHFLFRFVTKGITIAIELGLIISAYHLVKHGRKVSAILCACLGMAGLAVELNNRVHFSEEVTMEQKLFTRNFTFLILGQVSSLIGNSTLKFALSMYVLEQTGSASIFASLLALAMLPTILLSPFGGILADRANRRNVMVALDTFSGLSVLIATVILPFGYDIFVIGALLVILSVLGAFESPTVQACIPQMLSGDNLMKGNAAVNQVAAIASLVTPFWGSLVYTAFGLIPVLYGAVVCFFFTAVLECFIRLEHQKSDCSMRIGTIVKRIFPSAYTSFAGNSPTSSSCSYWPRW